MSLENYYNDKWDKLDEEQDMFEAEAACTIYNVELNIKDFNDLYDYSITLSWQDNLPVRLEKYGCMDTDFDPYFGAYVVFQLNKDSDNKDTWEKIEVTIKEFIEEARQWRQEEENDA
jgi:hypothetical protein